MKNNMNGTNSDFVSSLYDNTENYEDGSAKIQILAIVELSMAFVGLLFNIVAAYTVISTKEKRKSLSHW